MTTARTSCLGVFVVFATLIWSLTLAEAVQMESARVGRVLLVHDSGDLLPSSTADPVLMMQVLLSHFADEVVVKNSTGFVPDDAANYDGVVILSTQEGVSQISIPQDHGPVVWVGLGIPESLPPGILSGERDFFDFDHVVYGTRQIFAGEKQQASVFSVSAGASIIAEATDLQESIPLAIKIPEKKFWLFAGIPFWEGGELVFADILHDAFGTSWKKRTRAFSSPLIISAKFSASSSTGPYSLCD